MEKTTSTFTRKTSCILITSDECGKQIKFNMPVAALHFDKAHIHTKCHKRIALKTKGLCAEVMLFSKTDTLDKQKSAIDGR